jgi:S-(hydroxymethyl)glutathione dehydrogenase/alcohol dehydrogenase
VKTKGALLWQLNSGFSVDEIEVGDPVEDEVQIQMHAAGMCHSDYHLTTGATPIGLPALRGHEGAGVDTKVGKGVAGIAEGDHVILAFIPACGPTMFEGLPATMRPGCGVARWQGDR